MSKDWIIDVLGDMRAFAADNGLTGLAHHLDEAMVAATVEIAQTDPTRSEGYDTAYSGAYREARTGA